MLSNLLFPFNQIRKPKREQTALHNAVIQGNIEKVRELIAQGADINAQDEIGLTPLHMAAGRGDSKIVEILLSATDIALEIKDDSGETPLHKVARMGERLPWLDNDSDGDQFVETLKLLLMRGSNPEIADEKGRNPLHVFARSYTDMKESNVNRMFTLLWRGYDCDDPGIRLKIHTDIDIKDNIGWTPLHHAAFHLRLDRVELLMKNGANHQALTQEGNSPSELTPDHFEVANLIYKLRKPQIMLGLEKNMQQQQKEIMEINQRLGKTIVQQQKEIDELKQQVKTLTQASKSEKQNKPYPNRFI